MRKMIRTQMEVEVEVELLGIPGQRPAVYSQFIICLLFPLVGMKRFYKCVTRAADICRRLTLISHCKITQFHQSEFLNICIFFLFSRHGELYLSISYWHGFISGFSNAAAIFARCDHRVGPLPAAMSTQSPSTAV